ncbi:hypothetical protein ALC57_04839 [Trachymyrmex cornetzi]|uniref:Ig-like domain-containing protein n=1 Tax=Trachymyrmex cornetzi TaxID=471704 RepID=A0A195ECW0_9HYME|nr:hypothetical protein ALC57_04839 [Trachymyrmex cornetzi]
MSLCEWYAKRVVLLTGVTSELGRVLLEKILRCLPDVRVYVVLRSQNGLNGEERLKKIFASPGYERLRQEMPGAISRVKTFEGNLLYEDLALSIEDKASLREVTVAFHAAGPHDSFLEYCQELPKLRSIAVASSIFRHRGRIAECLQNEKIPNLPIALVRFPCIGPAYKEPMPGFVESLKGPTALMIGAGFAYGNSELPAEIIPVDIAVNTMIAAAWEVGIVMQRMNVINYHELGHLNVLFFSYFLSFSRRTNATKPVVYNASQLGCTWDDLIKKSRRASSKFPYPTFGIRGMTSIEPLYWILVIFLEWLPSLICDIVFGLCGRKQRILAEYDRVRNALQPLKSISSRSWPVERNRVYLLKERLTNEERDVFPIVEEIDIESYVLCVAAATRKYCCVNEDTLNIIKMTYDVLLYPKLHISDFSILPVSWVRHRDIHLLTVGTYTYTSDQRFEAMHKLHTEEWILRIRYPQRKDSGIYECQISTTPPIGHPVRLTIVAPRDIVATRRVEKSSLRAIVLKVRKSTQIENIVHAIFSLIAEPVTEIAGGPELFINKDSTINLTCYVRHAPEPPSTIIWSHNHQAINFDSPRGGISLVTEKGPVTSSRLLIQKAIDRDSGLYTCSPNNTHPNSVRVHIVNAFVSEHPAAMHHGRGDRMAATLLPVVLLLRMIF